MGESESIQASFKPTIAVAVPENSTAAETRKAARILLELKVDLLLFVGGDGTARDILDAVDMNVPVLGIPAGVKMNSAVFAINPREAGTITIRFLHGELPMKDGEVMDIDEDAYRAGRLSARLYGYMKTPYDKILLQGTKIASPQIGDEIEQQRSVAKHITEEIQNETLYILGPGTTVKAIADELGLQKTLLGVDVIQNRQLLKRDATENGILQLLDGHSKIIVTPIGGQAYIFGRGNQQISPSVIRAVGKENIIVVATKNKLHSLPERRLLVDTGDSSLDASLRGYIRVVTDYREETVMRVE